MLSDLAKQLANDVSSFVERAQSDAPLNNQQLQTLLQSALRKCDLVTREEFDAQSNVLRRTREKLEALETQVAELEEVLQSAPQISAASQALSSEASNSKASKSEQEKEA